MDTIRHSTKHKLAGRYHILQKLGEGSFAETFLAEDELMPNGFRCVVKKLKPDFSEEDKQHIARRLFDSEAQSLHRLGFHGQIPQLFAHFEEDSELYIVEEHIQGASLHQELAQGRRWDEGEVLKLLVDILEVLKFVHQKQVIHRDLKPSNIIRRVRDGRLVLIDFGAVKQVSTQILENNNSVVNHTVVVGTPGYMPGEQLLGNPRKSSDIYAVGIIAISALTGLNPGRGELPVDDFTAELSWHDHAHVSPELTAILDKMVAYDFRQRYPSATEAFGAVQSLALIRQAEISSLLPAGEESLDRPMDRQTEDTTVYPVGSQTQTTPKAADIIINLQTLGSSLFGYFQKNSLRLSSPAIAKTFVQPMEPTAAMPSTIVNEASDPTAIGQSSVPSIFRHRPKLKLALIQGAGITVFGAMLASPHIASLCQAFNSCPTGITYNTISNPSKHTPKSALSGNKPFPNSHRTSKPQQQSKPQLSNITAASQPYKPVPVSRQVVAPTSSPVKSGQQRRSVVIAKPASAVPKASIKVLSKRNPLTPKKPTVVPSIAEPPSTPREDQREWKTVRNTKVTSAQGKTQSIQQTKVFRRIIQSNKVSYAPQPRKSRQRSVTRRATFLNGRPAAPTRSVSYTRRSSSKQYYYRKTRVSRKRK
jgi:serine/threonine protein kinase